MKNRLVCFSAVCAIYAAFCIYTLLDPASFSDDKSYLLLVDVFRGNAAISEVPMPFCWRPVVPAIVALIPTASTHSAFIIVSILFGAGFLALLYRICLEFTKNDIIIMLVLMLMTTGANLSRYAAAALVDTAQLFFLALVGLLVLQDRSPTVIFVTLLLGVFVKETVIFAGLFYIMYRWQKWSTITSVALVSIIYLVFRQLLSGTIGQRLIFQLEHFTIELNITVQNIAVGLFVVGVLWLVGIVLVRDLDREVLRWFLMTTFTIGLPIAGFGLFFAAFGARFLMPLWIGAIPMVASMLDRTGVNEE